MKTKTYLDKYGNKVTASKVARQGILKDATETARAAYGFNCGTEDWMISEEELAALTRGRVLAKDVSGGEHSIFLRVQKGGSLGLNKLGD